MSRSFKHRPFAGYCGGSQKQDKRIGNRIMRRTSRILTRVCDPDVVIYPVYDEVMNSWSMSQDGTRHYRPREECPRMTDYDYFRWVLRK